MLTGVLTGFENPIHLVFVLVVALIVLGPKRLPEVGRSLGAGLRGFRESLSGAGDAIPPRGHPRESEGDEAE